MWKLESRNPLKSGQCFLQRILHHPNILHCNPCRNPLKSGQCFLLLRVLDVALNGKHPLCRNPLKSGQCFLP